MEMQRGEIGYGMESDKNRGIIQESKRKIKDGEMRKRTE